jgi:excisionase family DNA binding protein
MREVAEMLGFGLNKVKMLVITGELRSVKDGRYRRILPEWVDEYVARRGRKWLYGKTREEVHDRWISLHGRAKTGPVPTKVPTLAEYIAYWLREVVRPNLAPGSYITHEALTRRHIVPGLGAKRLDKLQVCDVQSWLNRTRQICQCCAQGKDARRSEAKQRCCAKGQCCEEIASSATVTHLRRVLRTVLSQAITDGLVTRNVAAPVKLPPNRRRRGKAWTSEEARRLLESARHDDDPFYAAYVLVLVLGLRKGELLGLAWEDANNDAGELSMSWQLQRLGRRLVRRETKTDTSDSALPLPDICVTALRALHKETKDRLVVVGPDWEGNSSIFTTPIGTPVGTPVEPRNFNVVGTAGASSRASGESPCTAPAAPVRRCSSTSTCTRAWRCGSFATLSSP